MISTFIDSGTIKGQIRALQPSREKGRAESRPLFQMGAFSTDRRYFIFPAACPRFTLHDHSRLNPELPRLLLTQYLRWFVDWGGSVPTGVPNDVAMAAAQRDIFPSGHTMMILVLIHYSFACRLRVRRLIFVVGILVVTTAVYQRYHCVVDILAGALFAVFCLVTSREVYRFIQGRILGAGIR